MAFFPHFPRAVQVVYTRLQVTLQCDPYKPLSHPDFPELSKLSAESQHEVLATFDLPVNGMVTPAVFEQLREAEEELVLARRQFLRERADAIAQQTACPTLGDCLYYDAPGVDQEILRSLEDLELSDPGWEAEKIRPLWPKGEVWYDCNEGPYLEDYDSIPLGNFDHYYQALDALVEESWQSIMDAFCSEHDYSDPCDLESSVAMSCPLVPACMMSDYHLEPTGDKQTDRQARQEYADSQDSIQSMGDFWKDFYSRDSGKKIPDSHKSRLANDPNKVGFTKRALFHKQPLSHALAQTWATFRGTQDKADLVKVTMDMNMEKHTVRLPDPVRTSAGSLYIEWINLPRMPEDAARKLAESGWNNADICGVDLAVKSHVAVGTPIMVIISLVDGACSDMPTATMCAFEVNLAAQNNRSLNLPLLSLPFSRLLNDLHEFQNRVKIACQFRDPEGFNVGTPMLSFSSYEFSEVKKTAFERESLLRDSWVEIEKRSCLGGGRCIASQGVVQTWEKEVNPPLKEYAPLVLPPVPKPRRNFIDQQTGNVVKVAEQKSRSMRFKSPTDLWSRPSVEGGQTSTFLESKGKLRCDIPGQAYEVDPLHLLYYKSVSVKKDTLAGVRLARIDVRKCAQDMDSAVWRSWVRDGCMKPKITIRLTAATSCFSGLALGMCFDAYRSISPERETGYTASLVTGLPNMMWATRDTSEIVWDLDLSSICGHSFYALSDELGHMDFIIYVLRGNELVAAADWVFYVSFHVDWSQESFIANLTPTIEWPIVPGNISLFQEMWGPYNFDLSGTCQQADLIFLPGSGIPYGDGSVRTLPRIIASHFRSWQGKVRVSIEEVSSIFLSCTYMVGVNWNGKSAIDDLTTRKHWLVKSGEIFDLDLYSPFGEFPTLGGKQARAPHIIVQKIGGVVGPKDSVGTFGFFIKIHGLNGIYKNPTLSCTGKGSVIAWFRVNQILDDNLDLDIPGRMEDIVPKEGKYSTTNYVNPTSLLFSVTGLHGGLIRLHVTWRPKKKLGECNGALKYMQYTWNSPTTYFSGDNAVRGLIDIEGFTTDLKCGDFFGSTNVARSDDTERLSIYGTNATAIDEIRVSYEILEMKFYGQTICIR